MHPGGVSVASEEQPDDGHEQRTGPRRRSMRLDVLSSGAVGSARLKVAKTEIMKTWNFMMKA